VEFKLGGRAIRSRELAARHFDDYWTAKGVEFDSLPRDDQRNYLVERSGYATLCTRIDQTRRENSKRAAAWGKASDSVQDSLSTVEYLTWFGDATPVRLTGGVLTISVPNQFQLSWVDGHFRGVLEEAAQAAGLRRVKVIVRPRSWQPQRRTLLPRPLDVVLRRMRRPHGRRRRRGHVARVAASRGSPARDDDLGDPSAAAGAAT
jgi:hypothetical protein